MTLALVVVSPASAKQIPNSCTTKLAPRLCALHVHKGHVDHYRRMMGLHRIPYHWRAEAHPALRDRLLGYWTRMEARAQKQYHAFKRAPWRQEPFYSQAMCIHSHESVSWTEPGSPGGGMQFMIGTWQAWGGSSFAAWPSEATPDEQLRVAYRVVQHDGGWHEWSTHYLCGL